MYVTRYTLTPHYDIQRDWSGWMGDGFDSEVEGLEFVLEQAGVAGEDLDERWENWQDEDWRPWHHRDTESYIDFLRDLASDHDIEVAYNEAWGRWQHVHHSGLSCWPLEAETLEEALAEAASRSFDWSGFGHRTLGKVVYVCALGDDLHLFECDDTTPED